MAIAAPDWERLLDMATAKLPGVSRAMLKSNIFDVFHEFFDLSSAWLEDIAVPIVPDTTTYVLVPSEGTIIRLAGVRDVNNVPQQALMPTLGTISLVYPSTQAQTFTATVVKNVVLPTERGDIPLAPDWVLPMWGPSILDGVLGRMMGELSKSYSNLPLSNYHLKRFLNAIATARSATLHRNTFGAQNWSFPRQFGRGTQRGGFSTSNTGGF
jgi:hypothetical protein